MYLHGTCQEYLSKVAALIKARDLPSQTLKMKQNYNYYFNLSKHFLLISFHVIVRKKEKEKYNQVLCFVAFVKSFPPFGFHN